jgi:N6-L-threonylcarbamoyladenine synthase
MMVKNRERLNTAMRFFEMKILAIDTSCDETSVAILENDRLFSNIVSSQVELHYKWGGVVPSIAKRAHQEKLDPSIELALKRARLKIEDIDVFAVTYGPGLAIALEVGIKKAKELAKKYKKPLVAVDHMEGHIYSNLIRNSRGNFYNSFSGVKFPLLVLLVSGGHTEIIFMKDHGEYGVVGQTLDDAAGEAFDKVARPLMLGYPGGPVIEQFAENGDEDMFKLPKPIIHLKNYNFSFSGLKTASFLLVEKLKKEHGKDFSKVVPDFCASFQKTVVDTLLIKTSRAVEEFKPKQLLMGGGVLANNYMRRKFRKKMKELGVEPVMADKRFTGDNAAMIGVCAYYKAKRKEFVKDLDNLDRFPNLRIYDRKF